MPQSEALQIKAIQEQLDRFTEQAVTDITLEVAADLRMHTPKDTGYAKGNWITSVGSFSSEPVGSKDAPGLGVAAQVVAETQVRGYRLEQGRTFIVNNVEYIGVLLSNSVVGNIIGGVLTRLNVLGPRRR